MDSKKKTKITKIKAQCKKHIKLQQDQLTQQKMHNEFHLTVHPIDASRYNLNLTYKCKKYMISVTDEYLLTRQDIIRLYPKLLLEALDNNKENESFFNFEQLDKSKEESEGELTLVTGEYDEAIKMSFVLDIHFAKETVEIVLDQVGIVDIETQKLEEINNFNAIQDIRTELINDKSVVKQLDVKYRLDKFIISFLNWNQGLSQFMCNIKSGPQDPISRGSYTPIQINQVSSLVCFSDSVKRYYNKYPNHPGVVILNSFIDKYWSELDYNRMTQTDDSILVSKSISETVKLCGGELYGMLYDDDCLMVLDKIL